MGSSTSWPLKGGLCWSLVGSKLFTLFALFTFFSTLLNPFYQFFFYSFFTWLEEPVVVENVGRGIVEHVEEGPRPNLKNAIMKKILVTMILMMRPHSKIKLFREGVNVQRVI